MKVTLGLTALLVATFVTYQIYVGGTILGLMLDSVCWVFPVCPNS